MGLKERQADLGERADKGRKTLFFQGVSKLRKTLTEVGPFRRSVVEVVNLVTLLGTDHRGRRSEEAGEFANAVIEGGHG